MFATIYIHTIIFLQTFYFNCMTHFLIVTIIVTSIILARVLPDLGPYDVSSVKVKIHSLSNTFDDRFHTFILYSD